ncbi:MAG: hypothetical protein O2794_03835 [bacterium]|nr:hypothetical protein [bacterium]
MDNFQQSVTPPQQPASKIPQGTGLALGVGIGVAIGIALKDLGLGLGVGIGLAVAFEAKSSQSLFGSELQNKRKFMLSLGGLVVALIVVVSFFTR